MAARLQFGVLGPLEVRLDGALVPVAGPRQRALLALLLLNANCVVSRDRLLDELLGDQPPASTDRMLRVQISRLRKALAGSGAESRLSPRPPGYVLRVEPGELDLHEFERLVSAAQAAFDSDDPRDAARLFREAEALWRGRPLADLEFEPFARVEVQRLAELRLVCVEERVEAELMLGRHSVLCPELEALVDEHPLRERLRGQLMLALYRCDRQADALASYRAGRSLLVDELGLEPSPRLKQLEHAILNQDAALELGDSATGPGQVAVRSTAPALERQPESPPPQASRRPRRWSMIAVAGAILLGGIAAAAATLSGGSAPAPRVAPNSLAAIDVRSDRVAAVVPVGSSPGPVTFGSGSLWVGNVGDQTITRVDPAALRAVRTVSLGATPTGLAASAHAIWIVQSDPGSSAVSVRRIDPQFNAVGPGRRLGNVVPGGPGSVAPEGNTVWIAPSSGLLTRLDARTGRVLQQLEPNADPAGITAGDGVVWMSDSDADSVTRVDPNGLLSPIPVGNGPSAIAVGSGGVWVADTLDDAVVRIDPSTSAVTTTIPVGRSPSAIAVGAGSVWVANSGDGTITRIDASTEKVARTISVGGSPRGIVIAGGRAWVTIGVTEITRHLAPSGGTLRMETLSDVDSLDPALAYAPSSWQLLYATCAKLLNYPDKAGPAGAQLTPEVARSLPTRSAGGKTYTFTLRPGFRFSPPSNQRVTARTFKDTIERSLNPRMKSPIGYEFTNIVGAAGYMADKTDHIAGIEARGDTLTIHLHRAEPDLPSRLAQPFFCAVPSNTPIQPGGVRVIPSAGPYHVASYTPGQSVVLARNPNYRGSRPHRLNRIALTLGISSKRAAADIEAGSADYTTIGGYPASSIGTLASRLAAKYGPGSSAAAHGNQQYFRRQLPELDFFVLNTHRPLFSDARLRQAVNYAIDRRALAALGDGFGAADHPTDQYLPSGIPGANNSQVYPLTPDLAKAKALARGHGRTAVLYTCNYSACLQLAQIVKNDLAGVGLRVVVRDFDHATLSARIARPDEPFDLASATWVPDYPDPAAMLNGMLANSSYYPSLNDPTYRRRLASAEQLTGPQRYLEFGKLATALAREAAPLIPYGNGIGHEFFSRRIGCQTYGFYNRVDLAALCIKHQHEPH